MKYFFLILFIFLSLPGFTQEDDEALVEKLQAERKERLEAVEKIQSSVTRPSINEYGEELKKLGYDSLNLKSLSDEKVVALVRNLLNENEFAEIPPEFVRGKILHQSKDTFLGKVFEAFPQILDCLVEILRDKDALSAAVGIFLRKDDMKIYGGIWICLIILAWLFKKIFFNPKWPKVLLILLNITVSFAVMCIAMTIFYRIFEKELGPSVKIIAKHFGF